MNRPPPLRIDSRNSNETPRSNESVSLPANASARERRRRKNSYNKPNDISEVSNSERNQQESARNPPRPRSNNTIGNESARKTHAARSKRSASQFSSHENPAFSDNETEKLEDMPPRDDSGRRSRSKGSAQKQTTEKKQRKKKVGPRASSNPSFLQGLEDDIVNDDEYEERGSEREAKDHVGSDNSRKGLMVDLPANIIRKSMPTDKYYVEYEKKFEGQSKVVYEKKVETRKQREIEFDFKQKQKDEQKFQILTPRTALNTHKLLRTIFLYVHGINVGFQFWQAVVVSFLNYNTNDQVFTTAANDSISTTFPMFYTFQNLALPIHCISYFFITICIIDCMDRVDFTQMNLAYFVKCISFQNPFWCIIFYLVAFISSLSIVHIDDELFLSKTTNYTLSDVSKIELQKSVDIWKSIYSVKAAFCMVAWLLFTIFFKYDMTYESLEKRDFSLLDDLVQPNQLNEQQNPSNNTNRV